METTIIHITPEQMEFIAGEVNKRLESEYEDIDESDVGIEIIGHGLDANLTFMAYSEIIENVIPTDRGDLKYNDVNYYLPWAELITFVDGDEVPNDTTCHQLATFINARIND